MSLNIGHFSRLGYDDCAYPEDVFESTAPFEYVTSPDRIHNCDGCLNLFGPIAGRNGPSASTPIGNAPYAAQRLVDIDSIMTNRNVPLSKCKRGKVNPVNVTKLKTKDLPTCRDYLDSQHSKMTDPAMFYRGKAISRFFDPIKDPQANIFYDWSTNSTLEAKDNYIPRLPVPMTEFNPVPGEPGNDEWVPCSIALDVNANCGDNGGRCGRKMRKSRNRKNNELNSRRVNGNGTNYAEEEGYGTNKMGFGLLY